MVRKRLFFHNEVISMRTMRNLMVVSAMAVSTVLVGASTMAAQKAKRVVRETYVGILTVHAVHRTYDNSIGGSTDRYKDTRDTIKLIVFSPKSVEIVVGGAHYACVNVPTSDSTSTVHGTNDPLVLEGKIVWDGVHVDVDLEITWDTKDSSLDAHVAGILSRKDQ
jgi:hypothetical protein